MKKTVPNSSIIQSQLKGQYSSLKLGFVNYIAEKARRGVVLRETTKSLFVKHFAIIRKAYKALSSRLHSQAVLPDEDLIFFFTHEEILKLLIGLPSERSSLLTSALRRRRLLPEQQVRN